MLAALQSITCYPIILDNIYITKFEKNHFGIYAVRLFDNGVPICIYVDDILPKGFIV